MQQNNVCTFCPLYDNNGHFYYCLILKFYNMQIAKEVLESKEVCEKVNEKVKVENGLRENDVFKITNLCENIKHNFMFAVVETADKRAVEIPFFYFWHNNIRIDTNLNSTFKVVGFELKNNINYPKIIIL